jgi:hypothetical protein
VKICLILVAAVLYESIAMTNVIKEDSFLDAQFMLVGKGEIARDMIHNSFTIIYSIQLKLLFASKP